MNRLLFTLAILLFSLTTLPAQYFNKYVEDGEQLFLQEDYYGALFYYGAALDIREDVDIRYKYAESARMFSLFSEAENSYLKLIEMRDSSGIQIPPDVGFQLAMVTKQLGKYEEAHELFNTFAEGASSDDPLAEIAAKEAEICLQVIGRIQSPDKTYAVRNIDTTGVVINSRHSEFASYFNDDLLYYTSYRFSNPEEEIRPRRPYKKVLKSVNSGTGALYDQINVDTLHTAYLTFNTDRTKVYYSLCKFDEVKRTQPVCDIYMRDVIREDSLGPAIKLPEHINAPGFSNAQPNIGRDAESGKEFMFFVSDRAGGKGATDIWCSFINSAGEFSQPFTVAKINTEEEETSPFFHTPTQTLYYSSKGRYPFGTNWGYGGFDVYSSVRENGSFQVPSHLDYPINSNAHEVAYQLDEGGLKALFSSNRVGSVKYEDDLEFCCFDIYEAERRTFQLNVLTCSCTDKIKLTGSTVQLYEKDEGGSLILLEESTNEARNDHHFTPDVGQTYVLRASKSDHETAEQEINLDEINSSKLDYTFCLLPTQTKYALIVANTDGPAFDLSEATIQMTPADDPSQGLQAEQVGDTIQFSIDLPNTYSVSVRHPDYMPVVMTKELTTADVNPDACKVVEPLNMVKDEIELVVNLYECNDTKEPDVMKPLGRGLFDLWRNKPGVLNVEASALLEEDKNVFRRKIRRTQDYALLVSRAGFLNGDTIRIESSTLQSWEQDIYEIDVCLEGTVWPPFPIFLYFGNDKPGPKYSETSNQSFNESYQEYYQDSATYVNEYKKLAAGEPAKNRPPQVMEIYAEGQARAMTQFFNKEIIQGFENLDVFAAKCLQLLKQGKKVEVTMKGYASPKPSVAYNRVVSLRRIDCITQYFQEFEDENGKKPFSDYMKGDNKKFIIHPDPVGGDPTRLTPFVKEKLKFHKNSKYSLFAARERKVEISGVKIDGVDVE